MTLAAGLLGGGASLGPVWDADLGWMLAAGRAMAAGEGVPRVNGWSVAAWSGHPWVMHEWGYARLEWALFSQLGYGALGLLRVAALALTVSGVWSMLRALAAREAAAITAVVLLGVMGRFESVRPIGMTLGLGAWVAALAFAPSLSRLGALGLGLFGLVWSWAHGSYPLAWAITLAAAIEIPDDRGRRLGALAAMALGSSLGPYGLALHGLVSRYLYGRGDDATAVVAARIVEWWPLWRAPLRVMDPTALTVGLGALALALLALARWPRRPRVWLSLALAALALWHARNLVVAVTVGLPLLAAGWRGGGALRPQREALAMGVCLMLGLGALTLVARRGAVAVDPSPMPAAALRLTAMTGGAGVFVTLPFAGWALYHGRRVYWDSRNDCYPGRVVSIALDLDEGRLGPDAARAALDEAGVRWALVRCDGRGRQSLAGWALAGRDAGLCLFRAPPYPSSVLRALPTGR